MGDVVRRLVWITLVSCAIAYAVFLAAGSALHADAESASRDVFVRDVVGVGVHHLSGMVMVPKTCMELFVKVEQVSDTVYKLGFSMWEQPSIACKEDESPRAFNTIVFAPSIGVTFIGALEKEPLNLYVIPKYDIEEH